MVDSALLNYLKSNDIEYYLHGQTKDLVSFKIGGKANIIVFPKNTKDLCEILIRLKSQKRVILGNGTNCYFTSGVYSGAVVCTNKINDIFVNGEAICAECGASLNKICKTAQKNSLSGLEFAFGIPGSIGGAVTMNASAFGSDISTIVKSSMVFDISKEEILNISSDEHFFSTKTSVFRKQDICLLKSSLQLKMSDKDDILRQMEKNIKARRISQPLDLPSAGSTFVRPRSGYASYMIDMCGLKGAQIGGARVSFKHAGFIVNSGRAIADDVQALIRLIKTKVFEKFNVVLEEEIIYID